MYIALTAQVEIDLFTVIHLDGYIRISFGVGSSGADFVLEGTVSTEIEHLGALTGTVYFNVFAGANAYIVGRVCLALAVGGGMIPGVSLNGFFVLEFNSDRDTAHTAYTFDLNPATAELLRNPDGTPKFVQISIQPGLKLFMQGSLQIGSVFDLEAKFVLEIDPVDRRLEIYAEGTLHIVSLIDLDVTGWLYVGPEGLVCMIDVNLDAGFAGLEFEADAYLGINTTGASRAVPDHPGQMVEPGVRINISGRIEIFGFAEGEGFLRIEITSGGFEAELGLDFNLFGLTFGAHGGVGIYADGIALYVDVALAANMEIVSIEAAGKIAINTTESERLGIASNSFYLDLSGAVSVLEIVNFNTSLIVEIGGAGGREDGSSMSRARSTSLAWPPSRVLSKSPLTAVSPWPSTASSGWDPTGTASKALFISTLPRGTSRYPTATPITTSTWASAAPSRPSCSALIWPASASVRSFRPKATAARRSSWTSRS